MLWVPQLWASAWPFFFFLPWLKLRCLRRTYVHLAPPKPLPLGMRRGPVPWFAPALAHLSWSSHWWGAKVGWSWFCCADGRSPAPARMIEAHLRNYMPTYTKEPVFFVPSCRFQSVWKRICQNPSLLFVSFRCIDFLGVIQLNFSRQSQGFLTQWSDVEVPSLLGWANIFGANKWLQFLGVTQLAFSGAPIWNRLFGLRSSTHI